MLKYTLTLYILIKRISFEQKLLFKNMAFLVSLPDRLYIYLNISPGAKRCLNGTSKVNRHTDTQTDRQTNISTYRKHQPMLWKIYDKLKKRRKKHNKILHLQTTLIPQQKTWNQTPLPSIHKNPYLN